MENSKEKRQGTDDKEVKQHLNKRHFILPVIIIVMLYGTVVLGMAETQYGYFVFQSLSNITSDVSESRQSLCEVNTSSLGYKLQQEIQSHTAVWNAYCHLANSVPVLVMALMVGSWSDKVGRRASLLVPTFGIMFKAAFFALGIGLKWNVYTFIIPFFVDGLCGSWISLIAAAYSYAADLTEYGKSRLFGMIIVEIILGFGVSIGNGTSGFAFKYLGFLYSTIFVLGITILNVFLVFLLPESVKKADKLTSISQKQYLKNAVSFYTINDPLRWKFQVLGIVFAFNVLPNIGRINVWQLYVMNSPFCWSSVFIGVYGAERAIGQMVIGSALTRVLYKCMSKRAMVVVGSLSAIGSYILMAVSYNDLMMFLTPVVGLVGMMQIGIMRAIFSGFTPADKQGAMFGSLAAIDAVCSLIGSVSSNLLYSEIVVVYKGLIMLAFGSCHLIALVFFGLFWLKEVSDKSSKSFTLDESQIAEPSHEKLVYLDKMRL